MDHANIISNIKYNSDVFKSMLESIPPVQTGWRPSPDKWSLLEIVNHLLDEEKYDFRQRLEFALFKPDKSWKKIEPETWVIVNKYSEQDFQSSLSNFLTERKKSVLWLKEINIVDWKAKDNYEFGKNLTAEQSLVNWLAHDYLHMRQITFYKWRYLSYITKIDLSYAGKW